VDRESSVVRFDNGIGNLGRRDDRESSHHSIRVFFTDLGDQEGTHSRTSSSSQRVSELETLKAVTVLGFLSNDIENRVDEFSSLSVMSLRPVVSSSRLSENNVIGTEKSTKRSTANDIHRSGFEIDENSTGNVFLISSLVVVNVEPLKLKIVVTDILSSSVDTVFLGNDLPELGTDLVTALTSLKVDDFTHSER